MVKKTKTEEYKNNECVEWYYGNDENGDPIVNKRGSYYTTPHEIDASLWEEKENSQVVSLTNPNRITQISFGTNFASAVVTNTDKSGKETDELYIWGQDQEGQLGINSKLDRDDTYASKNSPQPIFFRKIRLKKLLWEDTTVLLLLMMEKMILFIVGEVIAMAN